MDTMPTHVVIDSRDGMVFSRKADNTPFTHVLQARSFARERNEGLREPSYVVAALTVDTRLWGTRQHIG